MPGVDAARPASISCLYDNAPADDFVLDAVGPLTVATGFSGHGFKFGPVLGDLLAGLALDGTPVGAVPAGAGVSARTQRAASTSRRYSALPRSAAS